MKERYVVEKLKDKVKVEEYVRNALKDAQIGGVEVNYTPIGTKILIHTSTPGIIIGRGGEIIKKLTKDIKEKFNIENPQIDVKRIENPFLDPNIIAKRIAELIEQGGNYKRICNYYIEKIKTAGAAGCEIIIKGKYRGQRGSKERFLAGYVKKSGEPKERDVSEGFAIAKVKLGIIGIHVYIMPKLTYDINLPKKDLEKSEQEVEKNEDEKNKNTE